MKEEVRLRRPSIVATLLWAFRIVIIGLTGYCMINWSGGWTENLHDILLVLVAFSTAINAIAARALTTYTPHDMHVVMEKLWNTRYRITTHYHFDLGIV